MRSVPGLLAEHGRALESTGHTSEAVDEFLKLSYQFPDFPDLVAEALYNAVRIARARGEQDRAAKIEQGLKKAFPASPWLSRRTLNSFAAMPTRRPNGEQGVPSFRSGGRGMSERSGCFRSRCPPSR